MSGKDLCIGIIIGAALGAAATYLSNEKNRKNLCDNLKDVSDKAQDSLIEAYNNAKEQYNKYRNKLACQTEDYTSAIEEVLD